VDFICLEKKLIVEIDGGQHAEQVYFDNQRTKHLEKKGFKVLRFWNNEILNEFGAVLEIIVENLDHPSPYLLPSEGERKYSIRDEII
jgi:very-short-patch-repair endonuclease